MKLAWMREPFTAKSRISREAPAVPSEVSRVDARGWKKLDDAVTLEVGGLGEVLKPP